MAPAGDFRQFPRFARRPTVSISDAIIDSPPYHLHANKHVGARVTAARRAFNGTKSMNSKPFKLLRMAACVASMIAGAVLADVMGDLDWAIPTPWFPLVSAVNPDATSQGGDSRDEVAFVLVASSKSSMGSHTGSQ